MFLRTFRSRRPPTAPLTEGECTDADASCWRRDDRGLDLVEPECAMPSSRSTLSCHCFMAPSVAVELGVTQQLPSCRQCSWSHPRWSPGCLRSCMMSCSVHNSSAWHWAVGNLWRGRSSFFLYQEIHQSFGAVLHDLHHHAERENKQKPKA
jgi:hypothetical protein